MFRLDGKVIILTGAAHGLGAAAAVVLAEQGASLALVDIEKKELETVAARVKADARSYHADLSDIDSIASLTEGVCGDFGRIDVLINNAAVCPRISFMDSREEDWHKIMNINAMGPFFLMQSVCRIMQKQGGGKVINVISTSGQVGANVDASIYSSSKGAMLAYSKAVAKELVRHNISINCFSPGTMATEMINSLPEEKKKYLIEKFIPMGRFTTPEEMAKPLVFMCSDECSFTTGATFDFVGGSIMR